MKNIRHYVSCEKDLQLAIHSVYGGKIEVQSGHNKRDRIDILTDEYLIEVKYKISSHTFKNAYGQVMTYAKKHPDKKIVLAFTVKRGFDYKSHDTYSLFMDSKIELWDIENHKPVMDFLERKLKSRERLLDRLDSRIAREEQQKTQDTLMSPLLTDKPEKLHVVPTATVLTDKPEELQKNISAPIVLNPEKLQEIHPYTNADTMSLNTQEDKAELNRQDTITTTNSNSNSGFTMGLMFGLVIAFIFNGCTGTAKKVFTPIGQSEKVVIQHEYSSLTSFECNLANKLFTGITYVYTTDGTCKKRDS